MHQTISILIIEDEEIWATQLEMSLKGLGFDITAVYDNAEDALLNLPKLDFDIALLDININGKNMGIELGKIINAVYKKPFIFITGSIDKHTVAEAVAANPSAYLIKPTNDTSLFIAIQKAIENFGKHAAAQTAIDNDKYDSFFIKLGNRYKKISWNDVVALASDKKYTRVLLVNDAAEYFINNTLPKTIQYILPETIRHQFVQINRAEIINTKHILEIKGGIIKTPTHQFEATDNYIKAVRQVLHIV